MVTEHQAIDAVTEIVFLSSLAHTLLPPWEVLNDFPRAQKFYKVLVYTIGYAALNGRSAFHRDLSTQNGQQISKASRTPKANGGGHP